MKYKIGGVPEHFNLPWHLAIENGAFKNENIDIEWQDFHGGTGAMCKSLKEKEIDIAIVLTEGVVSQIVNGNPCKIVSQYVKSPLIWGIHCAENSRFETADDLKGATFSISRYGSGSHIMTYVYANSKSWKHEDQKFELVGNLDGARKAMAEGTADALLWEKFTTKPYVDSGELKRVGETRTPWPCFVIAVRNDVLESNFDDIDTIVKIIHRQCAEFMYQKNPSETTVPLIAERYKLKKEDVKKWLKQTEWATDHLISRAVLKNVMDTLIDVDVIEAPIQLRELCDTRFISFNKSIFNYNNETERDDFFENQIYKYLDLLTEKTIAVWGLMKSQHMVEHLIGTLLLSQGEFKVPAAIPKEKQGRARAFLLSDQPLTRNISFPNSNGSLKPLMFDNIKMAKHELIKTVKTTMDYFESNPNAQADHPYGGSLGFNEWMVFHYKHFVHHFKQFGLIE